MKKLINFIFFILSLIFFIYLLWYRFIRVRLPRDIPFDLTIFGLIILIIICISFLFSIYHSIIKQTKTNIIIITIQKYIFIPIQFLITFLIERKNIEPYITKYVLIVSEFIIKIQVVYMYILTELIPRVIIVNSLLIDIFYFHCIKFFYITLLLGLIIFFNKILLNIFRHILNKNIDGVDKKAEIYCHNIINYEQLGVMTMLHAKDFVNEQTRRILNNLEIIDYFPSYRIEFARNLRNEGKMLVNQVIDTDKFNLKIRRILNMAIHLNKILFLYEQEKNKYKYIEILILLTYLICWIYILIVSIHTLPIEDIEGMITSIMSYIQSISISNIEEPFSGIPMKGILDLPVWYTWRHAVVDIIIYSLPLMIGGSLWIWKKHIDYTSEYG